MQEQTPVLITTTEFEFKDPLFPPRYCSISPTHKLRPQVLPPVHMIKWHRTMMEATTASPLFTHFLSKSRHNSGFEYTGPGALAEGTLTQGVLSTTWLLNGMIALSARPSLIEALFLPTSQERHVRVKRLF
jgi:hypothetical protein